MPKLNLFADLPETMPDEIIETILPSPHFTLERILSRGQATPPGEWLSQEKNEWVILLSGAARLCFENLEEITELGPGDYVHIPAGMRHRVDWTDPGETTVWLALHY